MDPNGFIDLDKLQLSPIARVSLSGYLRENPGFRITAENADGLANLPPLSVFDRAERLLSVLARRYPQVGEQIDFEGCSLFYHTKIKGTELDPADEQWLEVATLGRCAGFEEVKFLVGDLLSETKGYLKLEDDLTCTITPAGWEWIERGTPNKESHCAFVAMSFDPDMSFLFADGIRPGVAQAGFMAERVDGRLHLNKIDDEIIAMLRKSRFCVADFTRQKNGVYFEAGFAKGLGLPVVWCCREDEIDKVHFDTRQYNLISWKPEDLPNFQKRLTASIEANIGIGPLRKAETNE